MSIWDKILGRETTPAPALERIRLDELASAGPLSGGYTKFAWNDGDKFAGGFGATNLLITDYWTLRARSDELFKRNLYARGLIRRLVTNEINTGLTLEAFPDEDILGMEEDSLTPWSEQVESRWHIWTSNPMACDFKQAKTLSRIQQEVRVEALVGGDVLVILRQHPVTSLPVVQVVSGSKVRTPFGGIPPKLAEGSRIEHGVEIDRNGRHVGFWVQKGDTQESERIAAYGSRTGRKMAWLIYGTDKRMNDVRGEPILSLALQSLKELDRYRDAAQRKALINSIVAMSIEKGEDKPSTLPITGGATRRDQIITEHANTDAPRSLNVAALNAGFVAEELQHGEKLVAHGSGAEVNLGPFEEVIVQSFAWANEVPPEILRLAFSNNYSASQAAINEFKMYLNRQRTDFGQDFCQPIYEDWLISEVLLGNIKAPGLLDAWRNAARYDVLGAWTDADWSGAIKPSTDVLKQAKGMKMIVAEGWATNERASREIMGMKFRKNMKRIKRENQLKVDAARPLAEFEREFGRAVDDPAATAEDNIAEIVAQAMDDAAEG